MSAWSLYRVRKSRFPFINACTSMKNNVRRPLCCQQRRTKLMVSTLQSGSNFDLKKICCQNYGLKVVEICGTFYLSILQHKEYLSWAPQFSLDFMDYFQRKNRIIFIAFQRMIECFAFNKITFFSANLTADNKRVTRAKHSIK